MEHELDQSGDVSWLLGTSAPCRPWAATCIFWLSPTSRACRPDLGLFQIALHFPPDGDCHRRWQIRTHDQTYINHAGIMFALMLLCKHSPVTYF